MPPRRIAVPKTPATSHNPHRPAGTLLRSQAIHMHEALKWHVLEVQAVLAENPRQMLTEKEVSDYIEKVSRILHPHGAQRKRQ